MQKFVRSLTIVAVLTLSVAPAMKAETMGTNPKPKNPPQQPSSIGATIQALLDVLGL